MSICRVNKTFSTGNCPTTSTRLFRCITKTIPEVLEMGKVSKEQIIGIGVDFTSCTVLPVDADGQPLCFHEQYKDRPHAYVKLWKHHAAQYEADRFNEVAYKRNEKFMDRYGGRMSSEWLFQAMQILDEDEAIYQDMTDLLRLETGLFKCLSVRKTQFVSGWI